MKDVHPYSGYHFNAGACYSLNREALDALRPGLVDGSNVCNPDNPTKSEDAQMGECLRYIKDFITANNSRDEMGREHFQTFNFHDHVLRVPYAAEGESLALWP